MREGGKEGGKEGGREGRREGGREGRREGGMEGGEEEEKVRGGGGASKDEPKHKVTRVAWSPSRGGREGELARHKAKAHKRLHVRVHAGSILGGCRFFSSLKIFPSLFPCTL